VVSAGKFGSWFLLLIISYTLVALIKKPVAHTMPAQVPEAEADAEALDTPRAANA
jgi:hypothetical protein